MKNFNRKAALFFEHLIRNDPKNIRYTPIKAALWLISIGWKVIFRIRQKLYDLSLIKSKKLSLPTICIGNISVGGTGKTPLTNLLAKELVKRNHRIAILLRGYKSLAEKKNQNVLVHTKEGLFASWHHIGDEAALLSKNIPQARIVVGKNRLLSAQIAKKEKVQALILDDGMQYKKIVPSFCLITLTVQDILGNNYFLPRGVYREPLSSLKQADLLIIRINKEKSLIPVITEKIKRYSQAPIVFVHYKIDGFVDIYDQPTTLSSCPIAAFCAIASPQRLVDSLKKDMNTKIVDTFFQSDHRAFNNKKLRQFSYMAKKKGAKYLVCSEKDRIKLDHHLALSLPIIVTKMKLYIVQGQKHWQNLVEKIHASINN